jgi:hypothetical protein
VLIDVQVLGHLRTAQSPALTLLTQAVYPGGIVRALARWHHSSALPFGFE